MNPPPAARARDRSGRRRAGPRPARWLVPPLSLLIAAGCSTTGAGGSAGTAGTDSAATAAVAFGGCAALTVPPSRLPQGGTVPPRPAPQDGSARAGLPDITLSCFAGGEPLRLTRLRGPAVLNLWGTFCPPCRAELPALQRLADRSTGRLHVVGVDTNDEQDSAASFGADVGITFPNLFDPEGRLLLAVGKRNLPATIFVDATGRTYVHNGPALDDVGLTDLVREHTGVAVPS